MTSVLGTVSNVLFIYIVVSSVRYAGFGASRPSCICCVECFALNSRIQAFVYMLC